jgi:hypothetical protein
MIGIISLNLRTYIIRIVSATLGAQCTQALRSQQFFRHNIKHLFLLGPIQRRIVKGNGKYHVGTYAPVHHITIHIVEQIAILIAEDVYERLSGDFCLSVQCIGKNFIAPLPNHIGYKTQGIVPQCIHFYNVARTWNNRAAIGGRVHPGNRFLGAIGIQQSVFVQEEIVMPAFMDIVNNLLEKITVHLPAIFTRSLLGILL